MHTISKEAKIKTDEKGFAEVKPEKAARATRRDPAPKGPMSDSCPVLVKKRDAFKCLQEEDEDDEAGKPFIFQTEKRV